MPKRTTNFREDLLADLTDPQEAAHYLNAALEDSNEMALALSAILPKPGKWPVWRKKRG
jgi:hypothetical protein